MTDRVTRKVFRNGGSVAVRIPKGWLAEDAEIELFQRDDGSLEIRPLDPDARLRGLLAYLRGQPEITEDDFSIPLHDKETSRFDTAEMFKD